MNGRQYSIAEQHLVYDWSEKWLELINLINEVTGTPQPPSDSDELRYQLLRSWLIDHQEQFVLVWQEFYECQQWTSCREYDTEATTDLEDEDIDKYLENPFLFFYEPGNLYQLAVQLDLQSSMYIWEPSESTASMIRPLIIRLGELALDLIDWIDA